MEISKMIDNISNIDNVSQSLTYNMAHSIARMRAVKEYQRQSLLSQRPYLNIDQDKIDELTEEKLKEMIEKGEVKPSVVIKKS